MFFKVSVTFFLFFLGSFEQRTGILFPLLVSCIERGISEKTRATLVVFLVIIIIF